MGELCTRATNQLLEEGESRAQDQVGFFLLHFLLLFLLHKSRLTFFSFLLLCFCARAGRQLLPYFAVSLAQEQVSNFCSFALLLLHKSRFTRLFLFLDHHHAAGVDLDNAQVQELQDQLVDLVDQRCSELVEEADDACLGVLDQIQERLDEN